MLDKYNYIYNHEKSIVHRINPVIKLIGLFVYVLISLLKFNSILFIVNLSIVFVLMLFSHISYKRYLNILWKLKYLLILCIFILLSLGLENKTVVLLMFKLLFFIFHFFLIVFTTKKEDLGKGMAIIINTFNFLNIKFKKLCQIFTNIWWFIIYFLDNFSSFINNYEYRGIDYTHNHLGNKIVIIFKNIKYICKISIQDVKTREKVMINQYYNDKINYKYKYRKRFCFVDYLYLMFILGMVVYYVCRVR